MRRLFFFITLFISINLFSQISSSNVSGVVKDKNGKKIEHAKVLIFYKSKGITYGTYTDKRGFFNFSFIETGGPYKLKIEHDSYLPYEKRDIEFDLGDNYYNIIVEEKRG